MSTRGEYWHGRPRDASPLPQEREGLAGRPDNGPASDRLGDAPGPPALQADRRRRPAVFLDRDGVINVDRGYVCAPDRFEWTPEAPEAIKWLNDQGYFVFVVTNQSGIARGYYSEEQFRAFSAWVDDQLRARGARLDAVFHCPHHPTAGRGPYARACDCRKPAPGLLLQAMAAWEIDREASLLIGDKESDLEAARRAGVRGTLYTGGSLLEMVRRHVPPRREEPSPADQPARPDHDRAGQPARPEPGGVSQPTKPEHGRQGQ